MRFRAPVHIGQYGGGGDAGEKDSEQRSSCQGGRFLDGSKGGRAGKPWQDMPQVKGLKELKLPVGNERCHEADMGLSVMSAFFWRSGVDLTAAV